MLRNGREGEVPSSHIVDVQLCSNSRRKGVKPLETQSLDSHLSQTAQLRVGIRPSSVSDNAAIARLSRQSLQRVSLRALSRAEGYRSSSRHMLESGPSQLRSRFGGSEPPGLERPDFSGPHDHQDAGGESSDRTSGGGELEELVAKQLRCLSKTNAMFVSYTISEDRTGSQGDFMATRLAAFGAHCERRHVSGR